MKTAEEWYKELITTEVIDKQTGGDLLLTSINAEQVKQIQLDAWKQGMTDALAIVESNQSIPNYSIFDISKAIHDKESI